MVVSLGALLADVPHTRPVQITGIAADAELSERLGFTATRYEGPTGIVGVVQDAATKAGMLAASLWAPVPHYVATVPSPKATLALLGRLQDLLEVPIDMTDLEEAAVDYERRLDEAVASEPEVRMLVERLERQMDDEEISFRNLPSGDSIAREFERFLKEQGDEEQVARLRSLALVVLAVLVVGCGDDSKDKTTAAETTTAETTTAQKNGPVPASLRTVESASEDIIDLALAGKRAEVVEKAKRLDAAANGDGEQRPRRGGRFRRSARGAEGPRGAGREARAECAAAGCRARVEPGFRARARVLRALRDARAGVGHQARLPRLRGEARVARERQGQAAPGRRRSSATTWDSVRAEVTDERAAAASTHT